jgi:hypothetical protein
MFIAAACALASTICWAVLMDHTVLDANNAWIQSQMPVMMLVWLGSGLSWVIFLAAGIACLGIRYQRSRRACRNDPE